MQVFFVEVSQNAKTGPIPASIIERASCWPGCALYENGCYAESGALALHWGHVSRGLSGGSWSEFCAKASSIECVEIEQDCRHDFGHDVGIDHKGRHRVF